MNGEPPEILDLETLDMLHDAIGASLTGIINLYLNDVPEDLSKMQQALASKDFIVLQRLAHSLKSSSANLGAMQTSALAAELEHAVSDGEAEPSMLDAKLKMIIASFDQARTILEGFQAK